jgi:hypothetical protein
LRVSRPPEIDKQREEENMNRNGYRGNIWVALAILLTASLWAAAASSRTLSFRTPVKLNGAEMTPGFYEVQWVSHSPEAVTFRRNGQVVATAAGKWVDRESKSPADSVVYSNNADGTHTLKELRFGGMKQVLVFGEAS